MPVMATGDRHYERAIDLLEAGKLTESEALLRKLLAMGRAPAHVPLLLAEVLAQKGELAAAANFARRACELAPDALAVLGRAVLVLRRADDKEGTMALLERAIKIARAEPEPTPEGIAAWQAWCDALGWCKRFAEAAEAAEEACRLMPHSPELAVTLASARMALDHVGPAMDVLRATVERWPEQHGGHMLLAAGGTYDARVGLAQGFMDHLRLGLVLERAMAGDAAARAERRWSEPGSEDAERPLRVGILSHDLRTHSVAYFLEPLLEGLRGIAGRAGLRMVALHTFPMEDGTSARLGPLFDEWHNIGRMVDARSAEFIAEQKIDVLVDCNGLTAGERLVLLQLRPAPLLLTYLGYPNITGLPAMDARLTDALTDPAEADAVLRDAAARAAAEAGVSAVRHERLVRLDGPFLCYRPPANLPEVMPLPCAGGDGVVTFGSFNAIRKLSDEALALWGRVLRGVPGSRLLVKNQAMGAEAARENLLVRLERAGVERGRVECLDFTGTMVEHLGCYGRIDIALDSFPYCGTTTTCEALAMGVPVVSRVGETHASRVGLALLERVGLGELAQGSDDGFVAAACGLAGDRARLAALRGSLRGRLLASPLCDGAGMAERFAKAVRGLWRERCGKGALPRL